MGRGERGYDLCCSGMVVGVGGRGREGLEMLLPKSNMPWLEGNCEKGIQEFCCVRELRPVGRGRK